MDIDDLYPPSEYLEEILEVLDRKIIGIERQAQACGDPDGWGLCDSMENFVGFGFVACQAHLVSVASSFKIDKMTALRLGPTCRSGATVAEAINHAANLWKHVDEWVLGRSQRQQAITEAGLVASGVAPEATNPYSLVLLEIVAPQPFRFASVLPLLESWRQDLEQEVASGRGTPAR